MRSLLIFVLIISGSGLASAQEQKSVFTYGEFKVGYGITQFGEGLDEQYEAGNFSTSGGGVASLAAYRKFKKVNHFNFGLKFKSLGAGPSSGDNGWEMFFNYWGAALAVKYFPFQKDARNGLFLYGDYYFASQFTQKYRNEVQKIYDHQFAIGNAVVGGIGYDLGLKNGTGLILSIEYEAASRQGEVTGVGEKDFSNTNITFQIGLRF